VLSTPLAVDTQGSKTTVQGDAKVIQVDYDDEASITYALTGVDVVISTVPIPALCVQEKIAAAAKEVDVKLFVPSEYGGVTEGVTEGIDAAKGNIQSQLKALGMPYAAFYTGPWSDYAFVSYVSQNTPLFFNPADDRDTSKGPFTSMSPVGKYPLVATAINKSRSPPDSMLSDICPMS
jgi:hypothetical protein